MPTKYETENAVETLEKAMKYFDARSKITLSCMKCLKSYIEDYGSGIQEEAYKSILDRFAHNLIYRASVGAINYYERKQEIHGEESLEIARYFKKEAVKKEIELSPYVLDKFNEAERILSDARHARSMIYPITISR